MITWTVFFSRRNLETLQYETVKRNVFTYELMQHYKRSEQLHGVVIWENTEYGSRIIYGDDGDYWY